MIERYFSAGNTTRGFVNYFDDAIDSSSASQIIYIKGGSGVGKSTLMRKVSSLALMRGADITHIHCSSDPRSLDGVVINGNIALFDATMPHIADPLCPRANGKILDLSVYLDEGLLAENKQDIIARVHDKKSHYKTFYSLLSSLSGVIDSIHTLIDVDMESMLCIKREILSLLSHTTRSRRGFLKAIDKDSIVDMTDGICGDREIISILSDTNIVSTMLIDSIHASLRDDLMSHEIYYSLLEPDKVETIAMSDKVVTLSNRVNGDIIYNIDNMVNIKNINAYTILSQYVDDILSLCSRELSLAKEAHNALEDIYRGAMDFTRLNEDMESEVDRLLSLVK